LLANCASAGLNLAKGEWVGTALKIGIIITAHIHDDDERSMALPVQLPQPTN
jgi:hypothetical protein